MARKQHHYITIHEAQSLSECEPGGQAIKDMLPVYTDNRLSLSSLNEVVRDNGLCKRVREALT